MSEKKAWNSGVLRKPLDSPRLCRGCGDEKPAEEFGLRKLKLGNLTRASRCKACARELANKNLSEMDQEKRELRNSKLKEYHKSRPEPTSKNWHKSSITRRFSKMGFTVDDYQVLLEKQNNLCSICGCPEMDIAHSGQIKRLAVDHCHKSNKIRELLCGKCNKGLGMFKDNIDTLKKAISYLEKHREEKA